MRVSHFNGGVSFGQLALSKKLHSFECFAVQPLKLLEYLDELFDVAMLGHRLHADRFSRLA